MGVLPLEFKPGTTRLTLKIDGTETFDVIGERVEVPMTCRLDSDEEVLVYEAGGLLRRFAMDFFGGDEGGLVECQKRHKIGELYDCISVQGSSCSSFDLTHARDAGCTRVF
ncbi:MAG: hypothetical protein NVS9B10_11730 [Nevskia sp.]